MATLNLSHVTASLRNLLSNNVRRLQGGTPVNDPEVTLMPPELVNAVNRTLNLHLYHVAEDPAYRNAVGMDPTTPPISGQPMALRLFYVMTAHLTRNDTFDAVAQQDLLGLGLKTFHDNPVITDTLAIRPTPVSPPATIMQAELIGGGNRIEIIPRNLEPEENLNFWAAEDQKTPRVSAYYEVRTVFLSPEQSTGAKGTVFDVGLYVASAPAARLRGSRSVLVFQMPQSTGLGSQSLDVTPARTTLRGAAVPDRPRLRLTGSNLTAGDAQLLTLLRPDQPPLTLDVTLNPAWDVDFQTGEISMIPQASLDVSDAAGGVITHGISPGTVEMELTIRNYRYQGTNRLNADYPAGKVGVALAAHINSHSGPVGGRFQINIDPVVDLTLAGTDIALAVSGDYYTNVSPAAAPTGPGTFVVSAGQVTFEPLFPAPFHGAHPVQLFVNGAESQPYWIEVGP